MKKRVELIKIKQLLLKPSFTSQEAVALGVSASTLSYYAKTGVIVRLGHGVYSNPNFAIKALKLLASQGKLDFRKMARYSKILRVNITPYILMVSA